MQPQQPGHFVAATPVYTAPHYEKVPASNQVKLVTGNDPALEKAFQQYMKTGKAPDILSDGFLTIAYNQSQQPIVKTTPYQLTSISLAPGEKFSNVSCGDPGRWSYSVAQSGQGAFVQQHILVKPSMGHLATNLVITTNERIYNLRLISEKNGALTRDIRFWYPNDLLAEVNDATKNSVDTAQMSTKSEVNVDQMNFNYRVTNQGGGFWSSPPNWSPTQIFDDGKHTFIQFPENVSHADLPALFVLENGEQSLVNYRTKAPYFVVDKIFKEAVLVMGVGSKKEQVLIINQAVR
jgi:type IV secretion system protein TrbG